MAGSINKVTLIGRVGKDPDIRTLNSGDKIANLSLATSETWRDRQSGERKEKTEWHRVVVFNENIAKVVEQYVRKGALIYIEGALQTRKYTDQSGAERYSTEIVLQKFRGELTMLGGRQDGDSDSREQRREEDQGFGGYGSVGAGGGLGGGGFERGAGGRIVNNQPKETFELDDEIPFIRRDSVW